MLNDTPLLLYSIAVTLAIFWLSGRRKDTIPALIGSGGFFSYYTGAYHVFHHMLDVVKSGYTQDPDGIFRIPRLWRWDYLVNGTRRIAEVAAASDDVLSFDLGAEEILQADYTMGPKITTNPYHGHTIRTKLTRNIARCFPLIKDEMAVAFADVLPLENEEWMAFTVLPNILQVVARTSNRIFVGLPLCRNRSFLGLSIRYTSGLFKCAQTIALLPKFLKPLVGPWISPKRKVLHEAMKFLGPLIEERLAKEADLGPNWPGKPNDFVSWLLEDAQDEEKVPSAVAMRILATNTAAIHTSSMALVNAIFDLTTYPSHIQPMREEAERAIAADGWSKAALGNMHKIDSFLRESQRLNASSPFALLRKVVAKEGFRFSDGVIIPYGSFLGVSGRLVQHDPNNYENPGILDGFRFSRMREEQDKMATTIPFKQHMITTGPEHLVFGHGKHACPGRFFAATVLKTMLAHILVTYDIKAFDDGARPPEYTFGMVRSPNRTAKIWVRKRL